MDWRPRPESGSRWKRRPDASDRRYRALRGAPAQRAYPDQPRRSPRGLPVQVLLGRRPGSPPRSGKRCPGSHLSSAGHSSTSCSSVSTAHGRRKVTPPSRRPRSRRPWRCSAGSHETRSSACRRRIGRWKKRVSWDRSSRAVLPSGSSSSSPTPADTSSIGCSNSICAGRSFPQLLGLKKTIEVRGKADRVDVFHDGSLRVIDYKLGRLPDVSSVQIGVYAHCARAVLTSRDGRPHPVKSAMHHAFGDDKRLEGKLESSSQPADMAVDARASDFASIIDRIEAESFRRSRSGRCQWCRVRARVPQGIRTGL